MMITIVLSGFSGRRPTSIAAATAAPEEMPTGIPSIRATSRAMSKAVWLPTTTISSITLRSRMGGTNPAPTPRIFRCARAPAPTRLARLQNLADAGYRPAGADARDDNVDLAVRVVPDLF